MLDLQNIHISAGGNRHPSAADWKDDIFTFGAGDNIALWHPHTGKGISSLLRGHTDAVTVVRIIPRPEGQRPWILSGSADKTIRLWTVDEGGKYTQTFQGGHEGAVNTTSVLPDTGIFATGAADATVKVWRILEAGKAELVQTIALTPRVLPLAMALVELDDGAVVLAVAGTRAGVYVYHRPVGGTFGLAATLAGHEGWIRSLDFVRETTRPESDVLLASASQDKYTRLWRVRRGRELPTATAKDPALEGVLGRSLSNKPHWIGEGEGVHSITFEALLIGHEDWIYTAQWRGGEGGPRLLTTSADNSVAVWVREEDSGFWICQTRLGEISAQKGSTTATGSTGGFWIGLWGPKGDEIASLGRTGSWRIWRQTSRSDSWEQRVGISGHTKEVKSLAWSKDGSYLLSTGSDQTTRLLAPWRKHSEEAWHELARPQIHGYDLNCIDTLSSTQFISGADEKLLRVFNKPRKAAVLIGNLGGEVDADIDNLPEIANIPVLGLSNKAITIDDVNEQQTNGSNGEKAESDETNALKEADFETDHPPYEDVLSKYTLWPEHEKLYGHGYEISAVAASSDGKLVATACRASSIDHAVIRLYETKDWREIKPSLSSHSLTVTSLAFSPSNDRLLSVGRDRQWTVFARQEKDSTTFTRLKSDPKGHSRMILDCGWAPLPLDGFATAGRDKSVKIWIAESEDHGGFKCKLTLPLPVAATAVAFAPNADASGRVLLAAASEAGDVVLALVDPVSWNVTEQKSLADRDRPSGVVTALRWRPGRKEGARVLAVSSEDHSVRLYRVEES